MPLCKNDPTSTYKGTEPSPKGLGYCAHTCNIGTSQLGKDGNTWTVKSDKNKVKKWVKNKVKLTKSQENTIEKLKRKFQMN